MGVTGRRQGPQRPFWCLLESFKGWAALTCKVWVWNAPNYKSLWVQPDTGRNLSLCIGWYLSSVSVAVIKHSNQKQLEWERAYSAYRLQSMVRGSHGRNWRQNPGGKNWSGGRAAAADWLAPRLLFIFLLYTSKTTYPVVVLPILGWALHIYHPSRQCPTDMPINQSDGNNQFLLLRCL